MAGAAANLADVSRQAVATWDEKPHPVHTTPAKSNFLLGPWTLNLNLEGLWAGNSGV